jgi:hypothetical protein
MLKPLSIEKQQQAQKQIPGDDNSQLRRAIVGLLPSGGER